MTWVLPEKYEEGLLDEKGEPLSKRCGPGWGTAALLQHRMQRQQARPGRMAARQRGDARHRGRACFPAPLQRVQAPPEAGAEGEGAGGEEGASDGRPPPPAAARPSRCRSLRLGTAAVHTQACVLRVRLQAKQAAEAAARAAAKAAKGDAAAALEDDSNEETDPTKSVGAALVNV